jgi:hypothetical protein
MRKNKHRAKTAPPSRKAIRLGPAAKGGVGRGGA